MRHLSLRYKLLIAFLIVLLPMLALIIYEYNIVYWQLTDGVIDDQVRTSQAIAVMVDISLDDAFAIALSFSKNPVLLTMNPEQIDPYLEDLVPSLPEFEDIGVFDLEGKNVGSFLLRDTPATARPTITERPYFLSVKSTGQAVVSNVLISRASGNPTAIVAVPVRDRFGAMQGVTVSVLDLNYLVQRLATVSMLKSQAIFLTDTQGTVAFHTGLPREEWGHRCLSDYSSIRSALSGVPAVERGITSPLGDERITVATPTPKYG